MSNIAGKFAANLDEWRETFIDQALVNIFASSKETKGVRQKLPGISWIIDNLEWTINSYYIAGLETLVACAKNVPGVDSYVDKQGLSFIIG